MEIVQGVQIQTSFTLVKNRRVHFYLIRRITQIGCLLCKLRLQAGYVFGIFQIKYSSRLFLILLISEQRNTSETAKQSFQH